MSADFNHLDSAIPQIKNITVIERTDLHRIPVGEMLIRFNLIPVLVRSHAFRHFCQLLFFYFTDAVLEEADIPMMHITHIKEEIPAEMIRMRMGINQYDGLFRQGLAERFQISKAKDGINQQCIISAFHQITQGI